ncbi:hypothetical protein FRC08_003944 [Ceratobasidium sp. 394]|nr:hypothetical protein FRC08_003944 [Ceratobasidium sp. 394]
MSMSQLPPEIWSMIACFSSLEARATIASLNNWFYKAFGKTLYQDIYIGSALQLVKLSQGPKAARNLAETPRFTIELEVSWKDNWLDVCDRLKPAEYFGHVLQMTTSLRELRIEERSPTSIFRFSERASDPSFLPHLTRIQSPKVWFLASLGRGRPAEYLWDTQPGSLAVNRPGNRFHPAGASPTRVSLDLSVFRGFDVSEPSTQTVAAVLEQLSLRDVTVRHLRVVATPWKATPPRAQHC